MNYDRALPAPAPAQPERRFDNPGVGRENRLADEEPAAFGQPPRRPRAQGAADPDPLVEELAACVTMREAHALLDEILAMGPEVLGAVLARHTWRYVLGAPIEQLPSEALLRPLSDFSTYQAMVAMPDEAEAMRDFAGANDLGGHMLLLALDHGAVDAVWRCLLHGWWPEHTDYDLDRASGRDDVAVRCPDPPDSLDAFVDRLLSTIEPVRDLVTDADEAHWEEESHAQMAEEYGLLTSDQLAQNMRDQAFLRGRTAGDLLEADVAVLLAELACTEGTNRDPAFRGTDAWRARVTNELFDEDDIEADQDAFADQAGDEDARLAALVAMWRDSEGGERSMRHDELLDLTVDNAVVGYTRDRSDLVQERERQELAARAANPWLTDEARGRREQERDAGPGVLGRPDAVYAQAVGQDAERVGVLQAIATIDATERWLAETGAGDLTMDDALIGWTVRQYGERDALQARDRSMEDDLDNDDMAGVFAHQSLAAMGVEELLALCSDTDDPMVLARRRTIVDQAVADVIGTIGTPSFTAPVLPSTIAGRIGYLDLPPLLAAMTTSAVEQRLAELAPHSGSWTEAAQVETRIGSDAVEAVTRCVQNPEHEEPAWQQLEDEDEDVVALVTFAVGLDRDELMTARALLADVRTAGTTLVPGHSSGLAERASGLLDSGDTEALLASRNKLTTLVNGTTDLREQHAEALEMVRLGFHRDATSIGAHLGEHHDLARLDSLPAHLQTLALLATAPGGAERVETTMQLSLDAFDNGQTTVQSMRAQMGQLSDAMRAQGFQALVEHTEDPAQRTALQTLFQRVIAAEASVIALEYGTSSDLGALRAVAETWGALPEHSRDESGRLDTIETKLSGDDREGALLELDAFEWKLDEWLKDRLNDNEATEDAARGVELIGKQREAMGQLRGRDAIPVHAVFDARDDRGESPTMPVDIVCWYDAEGQKWEIRCFSPFTPNGRFEATLDHDSAAAPPIALFEKLNDSDCFPKGWLTYIHPSQGAQRLDCEASWHWYDYLGVAALVIAGIALFAASGGAGAPATAALFAAAAGAGAVSGAGHLIESENNGTATDGSRALDVLGIVASLAGLGAMRASAQVASLSARGLATSRALTRLVVFEAASLSADLAQVILMTDGAMETLEKLDEAGAPEHEKVRVISLLLLSGVLTVVSVMSTARSLAHARNGGAVRVVDGPDGTPRLEIEGQVRGGEAEGPTTRAEDVSLDDVAGQLRRDSSGARAADTAPEVRIAIRRVDECIGLSKRLRGDFEHGDELAALRQAVRDGEIPGIPRGTEVVLADTHGMPSAGITLPDLRTHLRTLQDCGLTPTGRDAIATLLRNPNHRVTGLTGRGSYNTDGHMNIDPDMERIHRSATLVHEAHHLRTFGNPVDMDLHNYVGAAMRNEGEAVAAEMSHLAEMTQHLHLLPGGATSQRDELIQRFIADRMLARPGGDVFLATYTASRQSGKTVQEAQDDAIEALSNRLRQAAPSTSFDDQGRPYADAPRNYEDHYALSWYEQRGIALPEDLQARLFAGEGTVPRSLDGTTGASPAPRPAASEERPGTPDSPEVMGSFGELAPSRCYGCRTGDNQPYGDLQAAQDNPRGSTSWCEMELDAEGMVRIRRWTVADEAAMGAEARMAELPPTAQATVPYDDYPEFFRAVGITPQTPTTPRYGITGHHSYDPSGYTREQLDNAASATMLAYQRLIDAGDLAALNRRLADGPLGLPAGTRVVPDGVTPRLGEIDMDTLRHQLLVLE